jgi:hypothetical protein
MVQIAHGCVVPKAQGQNKTMPQIRSPDRISQAW